MANLSDAWVEIDFPPIIADEMLAYIKAASDSEYAIVDDGYSISQDEFSVHIDGSASGRWTYTNNLEGYFDKDKVKSWLGVDMDYSMISYLSDDDKKKYTEQAKQSYEAYLKLCGKMTAENVSLQIHYRESEGGNGFISEGWADFDGSNFSTSSEEYAYDIASYIQVFGGTKVDAIESLHGDEVIGHFYRDKGKDASLDDFEDWYDNEYEGE